jgi:hypothetical protein
MSSGGSCAAAPPCEGFDGGIVDPDGVIDEGAAPPAAPPGTVGAAGSGDVEGDADMGSALLLQPNAAKSNSAAKSMTAST